MKTQAHSLRRKAYRLHRRADQALRDHRTFDAAQLRSRAFDLEARAEALADEDLTAGFTDADLESLTGCTVLPRTYTGGPR